MFCVVNSKLGSQAQTQSLILKLNLVYSRSKIVKRIHNNNEDTLYYMKMSGDDNCSKVASHASNYQLTDLNCETKQLRIPL